jgi:hypothetical protein
MYNKDMILEQIILNNIWNIINFIKKNWNKKKRLENPTALK